MRDLVHREHPTKRVQWGWGQNLQYLRNAATFHYVGYCPISVTAMRFVTVDFKEMNE